MRLRPFAFLVVLLWVASALAAQEPAAAPMTQAEFVGLVNTKTPAADIIAQVRARGIAFEIDPPLEAALTKLEGGADLLSALREPATLEVSVDAAGAEIIVDGQARGAVPAQGPAVVAGLAPGTHLLRVQAERYSGERVHIFLKPGETHRTTITLTPSVEFRPSPLGLDVNVKAGSKEDTLVSGIESLADPAVRITRLQAVLQDYGGHPFEFLAYRMLQTAYLEQEDYDQALAAGQKILERDPRNFAARLRQARACLGKGDLDAAYENLAQARQLREGMSAMEPPESAAADTWESQKRQAAEDSEKEMEGVAYNFFAATVPVAEPPRRAAYLEKFLALYPASAYRPAALATVVRSYLQQGNTEKALEWGNGALESNPNDGDMTVIVADTLSELSHGPGAGPNPQEVARARQLASKLLEVLAAEPDKLKPAGMEDWTALRQFWEGMAHSILGQVLMLEETAQQPTAMAKTRQAAQEFKLASPLLKSQTQPYARNLYRLGYAYAKTGELGPAKTALDEVISLGTPYAAPAQDLRSRVLQALQKRQPQPPQ